MTYRGNKITCFVILFQLFISVNELNAQNVRFDNLGMAVPFESLQKHDLLLYYVDFHYKSLRFLKRHDASLAYLTTNRDLLNQQNVEPKVLSKQNSTVLQNKFLLTIAFMVGMLIIISLALIVIYLLRTRKKLIATNKELENLNRTKSEFFHNISHEFRGPLTLIMSPIEEFIESDEQKFSQKEAKMVLRNAKRLLHLINQVLNVVILGESETKMQLHQNDVFKYLKGITSAFQSLSEERNIKYTLNVHGQNTQGYFDEDKFEKIIYSIVSNAIKFSNENGEVIVNAEIITDSDYRFLSIEIKDNGIGISSEAIDKIYDPFFLENHPIVDGSERTGVSLALTKKLVELLAGQIEVHSEIDVGTTIKIKLPLDLAYFDAVKKNYEVIENIEQHQSNEVLFNEVNDNQEEVEDDYITEDKPIILIVDDSKDIRSFIRKSLGNDYHYLEAQNGNEGLEKALDRVPDIIISDLMMPVMNGIEFCNEIKGDIKTSHIPFIMLTAKAGQGDKIVGLEEGANQYLTKPFNKAELRLCVVNLINHIETVRKSLRNNGWLKPEDPTLGYHDKEFVKKAVLYVEENLSDNELSLTNLRKELGMSKVQLFRKFNAILGETPGLFIRNLRLKRAEVLLMKSEYSISEIAYEVGFVDPSYFTKIFKKAYNMSPKEYQKKYK